MADADEGDAEVRGEGGTGSASTLAAPSFVYVGGWADGTYPFRTYALDRATGALTQVGGDASLGANPSYSVGSADGRFIYVANEAWSGTPGVTVATIDARGVPSFRAQVPLDAGGTPVFTSLAGTSVLLAADYNGGRALSYRIEADGSLRGPLDVEKFEGPRAGASPETHSFVAHPSGRYAYAPNKAIDRIAQLSLDLATGKLTPLPGEPFAVAEDEPRIIAFSPRGDHAYVMHEKASTLVTFRVGVDGRLQKMDSKSTLPSNTTGASLGAHVRVHPSGKYVYASNRDGDVSTIAAFAIEADGTPRLLGHTPSGGKGPRHFDIDPDGRWLVVANQGTRGGRDGTLTVFEIGGDGRLTPRGKPVTGLVEPTSATLVTRAP
ncbi:MAG: beta-propeller fold lactonase family protein [Polyangiales bacterium]